jgi:hypothetical protein
MCSHKPFPWTRVGPYVSSRIASLWSDRTLFCIVTLAKPVPGSCVTPVFTSDAKVWTHCTKVNIILKPTPVQAANWWGGCMVQNHCNQWWVMVAGIEVLQTGALCHPLALKLLQRLHLQAGLGMWVIRICSVLGFASPALSLRAKSCAYYSVLPPVNVALYHGMLSEGEVVLVKAVP